MLAIDRRMYSVTTETEIDPRLKAIIAETMGVDEKNVAPGAKLEADLLGDSLDAISMAMAIEKEFAIEISDDLLDTLVTVEDVAKLVDRLTAGRN
ncbi:acyl carrier protein [Mesorhizobium silamurunense]|uniref:acyl carrier protein n=1 Tax=Mesorhizobium silamurunense TaxID=499528 RepID=UPI001AED7361|nr:acyl carrier protein [Mesorhizobium silamurunense]